MFVKGQPVTYLQNWDSKGSVRIVDLFVYSCGAKRMILVDAAGQKFGGRNFNAAEGQCSGRVVARLSATDAEAAALAFGAEIVADERARIERCITSGIERYGYDESHGYTKAMRCGLAALHEPRCFRGAREVAA